MEEWEAAGLGRNVPGYVCPNLLHACHQGGGSSGSAGRGERWLYKYMCLAYHDPSGHETSGVSGRRTWPF